MIVFTQQIQAMKLIRFTERKQLDLFITWLSQNQLWTIDGEAALSFWH